MTGSLYWDFSVGLPDTWRRSWEKLIKPDPSGGVSSEHVETMIPSDDQGHPG